MLKMLDAFLGWAMARAAEEGVLRLPAPRGRGWDRSRHPAIPMRAEVVRAAALRDETWRTLPWHPALAWLADCRTLAADQVAFLQRVHAGLRDGLFAEYAPLKYRSLQLTGDEKRLLLLAKGALFGDGKLSLAMLGCMPDLLPLARETVGPAPAALVFENASPFEVAARVLHAMPEAPYGVVAFGDGGRAEASLPRLASGPVLERVGYVGDLDRPGLRIARAAALAVARAGLPALEPVPGLHAAMLRAAAALAAPGGWRVSRGDGADMDGPRVADAELVAWLPGEVRTSVMTMLAAGRRVPEEVLGPAELRDVWTGRTASLWRTE